MAVGVSMIFFLALLPYVSPVKIPMDTTPYFILAVIFISFGIMVGRSREVKIANSDLSMLLLLLFFCLVLLIRVVVFEDLDSFRVFGNYSSLFFGILFFSTLFVNRAEGAVDVLRRRLPRVLIIVSVLYLLASALQLTSRLTGISFFFDIVDFFIGKGGRTSETRGFNSLAAEPSYAGITCSLIACISMHLFSIGLLQRRSAVIVSIFCAATVMLSMSATVLPFAALTLYVAHKTFKFKIISAKVLGLMLVGFLVFSYTSISSSSRIFQLAASVSSSSHSSLSDDVSALSRLASVINYSIPLLTGQNWFGQALAEVSPQSLARMIERSGLSPALTNMLYIGLEAEGGGLRTKSAIAQSLYLFGIGGIVLWGRMLFYLREKASQSVTANIIIVFVFLGYLVQVPLGHPTFVLAIGLVVVSPKILRVTIKNH